MGKKRTIVEFCQNGDKLQYLHPNCFKFNGINFVLGMTMRILCLLAWAAGAGLAAWAQAPSVNNFAAEARFYGETAAVHVRFDVVSPSAEYTLTVRESDPYFRVLSPPRVFSQARDSATFFFLPLQSPPHGHAVALEFVFSNGKDEAVKNFAFVPLPAEGTVTASDFTLTVGVDASWKRLVWGEKTLDLRDSGFMVHDGAVVNRFSPVSGFQSGVGWGDGEWRSVFSDGARPLGQTFFSWTCDEYLVVEYDLAGGIYLDAGLPTGRFAGNAVVLTDGGVYLGLAALWGEGRGGVLSPESDLNMRYTASDTLATGGAAGAMWASAFALAVADSEAELHLRLEAARRRYACQYEKTTFFVETAAAVDEAPQFGGGCGESFVAVEIPVTSEAAGSVQIRVCGGTARVPGDAFLPHDRLSFAEPGTQNAVVYVRDDAAVEATETLELCLVADCGEAVKACSFHRHTLTLYDNDREPAAPTTVAQAVMETQAYLGPRETVVFYGPGHRQLMAKIENLTDFDYGCVRLGIDRSGRGARAFQNAAFGSFAAEKTFYAVPERSHPFGRFRMTLYYTAEEINGWRAQTGEEWDRLNMFKSDRPIAGVTPETPNVNGAYGERQSVAYFGADYAVSAEFMTGFSGFGIGKDGWDGPLPVRIFDFTARAESGGVKLAWRAGAETNVARYVVERSTGGAFEALSETGAVGAHEYRMWDWNPPAALLYYRVRVEDYDGAAAYSEAREIRPAGGDWAVSFHPNPLSESGVITIHPPHAEQAYELRWRLMRTDGAVVAEETVSGIGTAVFRPAAFARLAPGVYILDFPTLPVAKIKIVKR